MPKYKLIPIKDRYPKARCWFCGTDKSVKYTGQFINPNLNSERRYLDILICNKCALLHGNHLREVK